MATQQPLPDKIDLRAILSESERIINAHPRHFLALSVLFLLPSSFPLSAYPFINQLFSQSFTPTIETHLSFSFLINNNNPFTQNPPSIFLIKTLIFTLLYSLFILIFSLLATGSIIYSVFNGFYGRPIKLISAIKSAFTSFFRLMSTCLVTEFIISGILLIIGLTLFSLLNITQVLGFQVEFFSLYFTPIRVVFALIIAFILVYLQVNWVFAYVVVVVESSWGLEPLKRSQNLVKGNKRVAFSMFLYFGYFAWIIYISSTTGWGYLVGDKWKILAFVLNIVFTSAFLMLVMLYNLAATTVFYIYSKAIHGELAGEEFAKEYLSLPFDDGKIPHVVYVV
ncbi:hypothetical protein REPUB_Repub04eG0247100 [Reevesia pubescens]